MALLTEGYWPSTYWPNSYWDVNYWPHYGYVTPDISDLGVCTIQAKSTIITNLLYTSSILLELNLNSTIKQEVRLDGNICW